MGRPLCRPWPRIPRPRSARKRGGGFLLPALLGVGMAVLVITLLDSALRPAVSALAQARIENAVIGIVNDAVNKTLSAEALAYRDLVNVEKDAMGQITALTTDSAKLNALRVEILGDILEQVNSLDGQDLDIPLGSLTGLSTASDWGPQLPVRVLTAATPKADFHNVFTAAGINQTLHRIMLDVRVEVTLLIPGGSVETSVDTQVCAAETLLMGKVPDTYLELPGTMS